MKFRILVSDSFLYETVQIVSHSINVTTPTKILPHLFSSVKGNDIYSQTNRAKLNSGGSILSIVKDFTLLTGITSTSK